MIGPDDRFFGPSGAIYPGGPSTWPIIDWHQRRLVSVTMDEELESEDPATEQLVKHIDTLAPVVYATHVSSSNGGSISTSTDPEDDETRCVYHPVSEFRRVLREWCDRRRARKQIAVYTEAPGFLDWPPLPDPSLSEVETHYADKTVKEVMKVYDWKRTELTKRGETILNWQRPPQRLKGQPRSSK
ncbi:uncharacterized protein MAM_03508 [Metarhizium album ARSEF 1941]|uniref:Uncharacterized protein n=1 Tax=Metarhizium album (strain ARSEF 1941) TaxID=1081103 RepID=A0A0B2WXS6_METAS|nr:uncharacterized protein MAM_03508 [Metarhizium album ARSEF 1941]KHN98384.1 hypothetical protein MAM_03508 [Metarhizium album ARSEF 1941]